MKKFLYLFFILFLQIAQADTKPKICLNMIVKNEEPVIERCLATVKPHIDYWVIVDTGSSDNTIKKIKEFTSSRHTFAFLNII